MTDYQAVLQQEIEDLKSKIDQSKLPDPVRKKMDKDIIALERSAALGSYDEKYDKVSKYIERVLQVPWEVESEDILDVNFTKEIFDKHHYGMQDVKDRFIEYVSVLNLRNKQFSDRDFRAITIFS